MIAFINSKILLLIYIFLFSKVHCELRIPLTYFPKNKYNDSSPLTIMDNIINQRVYANINIGTPIQEIQIPLLFDTNEFIIGDNPKDEFDERSFNDLKFYKSNKSNSYREEEDAYDEFCGVYFRYGFHVRDSIYLNNKNETFSFYLPYDYVETVSGRIGMQLKSTNAVCENTLLRSRSFFELVKSKDLINKYDWSIFYDSKEYKKEEGGFLLMGVLPHELNSDLGYYKKGDFQEKNLLHVYMKNIETKFILDKIYGSYGKNISNLIDDFPSNGENIKTVEFDFNNGGIQVPKVLYKYYENSFKDLISQKICFNKTFSGFNNKFFYCNKEIIKYLDKMKEEFPVIYLHSNDLNYTFTLDFDDLFLENGDFIYFLIYFDYQDYWTMGKPFLKKYQFSFNYDAKYIQFYQTYSSRDIDYKPNDEEIDKGITRWVLAVSIVGTFLLVALISFLIFKFYLIGKCFRKKRANELADDDYEYQSKDDEKKETENAQNTENEEKTANSENQQNIDENNSLGINFDE